MSSSKRKREWTDAFQEVLDQRESKKRRFERFQLQAQRVGYEIASKALLLSAFGAGAFTALQVLPNIVLGSAALGSVVFATPALAVAALSSYYGRRTNKIRKTITEKLQLPDYESNETLKELCVLFHSNLREFLQRVGDELNVFKTKEVFESELESLVQNQGAQKVIETLGKSFGPALCEKHPAVGSILARKLASEINELKGDDALEARMRIIAKIFEPMETCSEDGSGDYSWVWESLVAQQSAQDQQKDNLSAKIENGLVRFLNENSQRLDVLEKMMTLSGWELAGEKFPSVSMGLDNALEHFHSYMCTQGPLSAALSIFGEDIILRHADTRPDLPGQVISRLIDEAKASRALEEFTNKRGYTFAKENQKIPPEMSGRVQGWVQKQEEIKQAFQKDVEKLDMEEKEAIQDLDNSLNTFPEAEAKEAAALEEELEENLKEITKEEEKALARVNTSQVADLFGVAEGSPEHERILHKYTEETNKVQRSFRNKKATANKELEFKKAQLKDQYKKKITSAKAQLTKSKKALASKTADQKKILAKKRDSHLEEVDALWRQWRDEYACRLAESGPRYVDTRSPGPFSSAGPPPPPPLTPPVPLVGEMVDDQQLVNFLQQSYGANFPPPHSSEG